MSIPFERLEGKYEILEKMREGGMGAVYKVRHRLLEEIRVIKVMRPQLAQDEVLKTRFQREAKTAVRLRHPNLAQIFDFAIDDEGTAFIVMEFIDGLSLQDLLKVLGRPSLGLVVEIAAQALDVLGYLHRRGVVHRDIAPDNLLLTRDEEQLPQVKVIDLGIAKGPDLGGGLTRTGTFIGKVRYCSPEHFQTQQGHTIDGRSDLYSLGIVLYELASGVYPIRGSSTSGLISGHLVQPVLPFAESDPEGLVPEELRAIILKLLEKRAENRFQTAEEARTQVLSLRERHPVAADEVDRAFAVPILKPTPAAKPGSTQDHLDRSFLLGETPPPVSEVLAAATPPPPPASPYQTAGGGASAQGASPKEEAVRQQVQALLLDAEKLAQLGQLDEARLQLQTALDLEPANPEAERILAAIEASDRIRQEEVAEAADAVRAAIQLGELDTASGQLEAAIGRFGGVAELIALRAAVEQAARQARLRAKRVKERLVTARKLMEEESFEDAVEAIGQAIEVEPGNADAQALLAEAQTALAAQLERRRRAQEIADTCAAIAAQLDRRELDEAERALAIARKLYGAEAPLARVQEELAAARVREVEERREARRQETVQLMSAGRHREARELLEGILAEAPDDPRTAELIAAADEGLRRQEEEALQARRVEQTVRGIDNLILAGRFETAYRTIDVAVGELGSFGQAKALRTRIEREVAERRKREAQAWASLGRARSLAERGAFQAAESTLAEARAFETDLPEVHDLIEETERAIAELAEAQRRKQELADAAAGIDRAIERGALDDALGEIEAAERLHGSHELFAARRQRIEELVAAARRARVELLLREALGKQASFTEVIAKLEEALSLDPANSRVQRLLAETRTALLRYEQEQRAAAIGEVMGEVDALIVAGQFEEALGQVDLAVERLGDFREARTLRHRLNSAVARRDG